MFRAYDRIKDREVAIKVQKVDHKNGKELSLQVEYEAIKALEAHPNIANYEKVYRFEDSSGVIDYAIMQFYKSCSLSQFLKEHQSDTIEKDKILVQLLQGIAYLHHNNVVHRDIKPGNILVVDRPGEGIIPKITDFGLSKRAEIDDATLKFKNSFAGGTIEYCSPEQLRGDDLKFNTDLWSFGVIVFEVFTGRTVFDVDEFEKGSMGRQSKITEMIMKKDIRQELKKLPETWRPIAELCLKRSQEERPATGIELLRLLPKALYDPDQDYFLKQGETPESSTDDDATMIITSDDDATVLVPTLTDDPNLASKPMGSTDRKMKNKGVLLLGAALAIVIVGIFILKPIWSAADPVKLALVISNGKAGYIDGEGQEVIPPRFEYASDFSEGFAAVHEAGGWNFIDRRGEIAIQGDFDFALPFSNGLAPVLKGSEWSFIDKNGAQAFTSTFDDANVFGNGLAPVKSGKEWTFIDTRGKVAFDQIFVAAFYFSNGLAAVRKGGQWGFIDKNGQTVIPYRYEATKDYADGAVAVKDAAGSWGFVDKEGVKLMDRTFDGAKVFSEGLAGVKENGAWGFVDKKGEQVIACKYENVGRFSNGLAPIKTGNFWGFVDAKGNEKIEARYTSVGEFY